MKYSPASGRERAASPDANQLLQELEAQEGVDPTRLRELLLAAVLRAWSEAGPDQPPLALRVDTQTGRLQALTSRLVVASESERPGEISLERAGLVDPGIGAGDVLQLPIELPPQVMGNAARLARAALTQTVREARRQRLLLAAQERRWQLLDTVVERASPAVEALLRAGELQLQLPVEEQIPGERLDPGCHLAVVLVQVDVVAADPGVRLRASRTSPLLLRRLLEREVPEAADATVVVRAVAREPGERSKVAVQSQRPGIDPKGACIGPRGVRIRSVVAQLGGERVDVVEWSAEIAEFVGNALAPARVESVRTDPDAHRALVEVAPDQLTLAIGREGQNARLASRLTGWGIEIHPLGG